MTQNTIYTNARIFTLDPDRPYIENGYLQVEKDRLTHVAPMADLPAGPPAGPMERVDLGGRIVLPGMVCSHSHFYGQFVRGMPLGTAPANWQQILSHLWWKVDKALRPEEIYHSTLMGLLEGIRAGTTTYLDHHASPGACRGSLSRIAAAVGEVGARACLAYEVSDRDGAAAAREGIEENVSFVRETRDGSLPNLRGTFGLHASYTLSTETIEACVAEAEALDCGYHIHVAEDIADVTDSYRRSDRHVVDRLASLGVLGPKTLAAHCVHVGPEQWEVFRETGTWVLHNAQSNANNAVGVSPVYPMLSGGVRVCLASDGCTYDMFQELSVACALQRVTRRDPRILGPGEIGRLLFHNNFGAAGLHFDGALGVLKPGNLADFLVAGYDPPTPLGPENLYSHLTPGFGGCVETVVIGGRMVLRDGEFTTVDEAAVRARCREQAAALWDRLQDL